ncbi:hypothetical protein Q4485_02260 [Granulosicoccaceae sp. 1_MG-2023]|nr:hypothetical protein [Granulosicoccaceae sp. 1_MG-2023]
MRKLTTSLLATTVAMALTACSSSSSDSGGDDTASIALPDNYVQISHENAPAVAAAAMQTAVEASDSGQSSESYGGYQPAYSAATRNAGLSERKQYEQSLDCDSGDFTLSWDDADGSEEVDAGDNLTAVYRECVYNYDDTSLYTDGRMSIDIHAGDYDGSDSDMTTAYTDFVVDDGDYYSRMNGSMRIISEYSDSTVSSTLSSESLTVEHDDSAIRLSGLSLQDSYNLADDSWTMSYDALLQSTTLNGALQIETLSVFEGTYQDEPVSGSMKVSGANGSYVTIDAASGSDDTLYVTTFDGSTTTSEEMSWEDFYAAGQ